MRTYRTVALLGCMLAGAGAATAQGVRIDGGQPIANPPGGGVGATATGAVAPAASRTPAPGVMTVSQLEGLSVYSTDGAEIGAVGGLLLGPGGRALVSLLTGPGEEAKSRRSVLPLDRLAIHGNRLVVTGPGVDPARATGAVTTDLAGYQPTEGRRRVRLPFYRPGATDIAGLQEPAAEEVMAPVEILIEERGTGVLCRPPEARLPAGETFDLRIINRSNDMAILQDPGFFTADNIILNHRIVPAAGGIGYVAPPEGVGRLIMRVPPGRYALQCYGAPSGDGPRSTVVLTVVPAAR